MTQDNPAARLLAILERGVIQERTSSCRNTWRVILDIRGNDDTELFYRFGKVAALPVEIINLFEQHFPNQGPTLKHWTTQVNTAFLTQSFDEPWNTFIRHIDQHTLNYLSMTSDLLDMVSSSRTIDLEELDNLRESIDKLLTDVIQGDIDQEFKKYLVHYLRKIINAIDDYHITGAVPIMEALEATLGHAFVDEKYRHNISKTETGKKVFDVLSAVANTVTVAVGLPQLPAAFTFLLENAA